MFRFQCDFVFKITKGPKLVEVQETTEFLNSVNVQGSLTTEHIDWLTSVVVHELCKGFEFITLGHVVAVVIILMDHVVFYRFASCIRSRVVDWKRKGTCDHEKPRLSQRALEQTT